MGKERGKRKILKGRVARDKMQKTIVVEVERRYRHPVYKKVVRARKKYMVHNPDNTAHIGDLVEIKESRPLSKGKNWRLARIIEQAKGAGELERN